MTRLFNIQIIDPRDGSIGARAVPLIQRCRLYVHNIAYEFAIHQNAQGTGHPPSLAHYATGMRLCDLPASAHYLNPKLAPTPRERAALALGDLVARTGTERVAAALKRAEAPPPDVAHRYPRLNGRAAKAALAA